MVRAPVFALLIISILTCSSVFAKTCPEEFAEAQKKLERQIAANLERNQAAIASADAGRIALRAPIRTLMPAEVKITLMNSGAPFQHKFTARHALAPGPKSLEAVGFQIEFLNSQGQLHSLDIIGPRRHEFQVKQVMNDVLRLPADALEATAHIEVQSFIKTGPRGWASGNSFVIHQSGLDVGTVAHEFGHSLAKYISGRMNPFGEWTKVFVADGSKYVSDYAASSARKNKLAEDFADSVRAYLRDPGGFLRAFPNRAALLDTIFRNESAEGAGPLASAFAPGGNWQPIRQFYKEKAEDPLAVAARGFEVTPQRTESESPHSNRYR